MKEIYGKITPGLRQADLHVHTKFSRDAARRGSQMSPEQAVEIAAFQGLSAIAITDHDTIESAFLAKNYAERLRLPVEVILGVEVTTRNGHLVALGVNNPIPQKLSVEQTVEFIHSQGGLAIAPHPFNGMDATSLKEVDLETVISSPRTDIDTSFAVR